MKEKNVIENSKIIAVKKSIKKGKSLLLAILLKAYESKSNNKE